MRVLLLNLSADSLMAANSALAGRGYDVSTDSGLTVDQLLTLSPEMLITEITSSDMNCCTLVSQLKARPQTESPLKVVLIVRGGPLGRAHGLDLVWPERADLIRFERGSGSLIAGVVDDDRSNIRIEIGNFPLGNFFKALSERLDHRGVVDPENAKLDFAAQVLFE